MNVSKISADLSAALSADALAIINIRYCCKKLGPKSKI